MCRQNCVITVLPVPQEVEKNAERMREETGTPTSGFRSCPGLLLLGGEGGWCGMSLIDLLPPRRCWDSLLLLPSHLLR